MDQVRGFGINRLYTDPAYRARIVSQLSDTTLRDFWELEFETYVRQRKDAEYTEPINNKVGRLLYNPITRRIFGQPKSKVHLDQVLSRGKILIVNLSKGALGEDIANFIGSILVSSIIDTAMSRHDIPEHHRRDHTLIVDEFHSFSTPRFATALSESRKYNLSLVLGLQYLAQLAGRLEPVKHAVFGNVGSLISFKIGSFDSEEVSKLFDDDYAPRAFVELDPHRVIAKLATGNRTGQPFQGISLPPIAHNFGGREKIIKRSRKLFATPRKQIDARLNRWWR